jgi:NAD(P)-dependent dehydrogenase (short-subunit alcohol dehydrogenase family)
MDLNLLDKVIVVTGAASGIGKSISRSLTSEKAVVCIIDRNGAALADFAKELEETDATVFPLQAELTNHDECSLAIEKILKVFGQIYGLVNNAGINDGVSLEYGDLNSFNDSLDKNVAHYHMMAQLCLPSLKKTKGAIVNICSKTGETGQGGTSGYAAANGARLHLTNEWAESFPSTGVRANAVVVAECWTPQYEWWISQQPNPKEKLEEISKKIPLGNRMTTTEEIANAVLFLLSPNSKNINGQWIHVDGGYVHLDRAAVYTL